MTGTSMGWASRKQVRMVTVGATLGLELLLGGCGSGSTPASAPAASVPVAGASAAAMPTNLPTDLDLAPTASPATTATAAATATAGIAALRGTVVPKHFPFPKGATPTVVASGGLGATLALSGVTGDEAIRYYRQAMPAAGYTFQHQVKSDSTTELTFVGYNQSVEVASNGTGAAQTVTLVFAPQ
ncbi:hypothetical protein [Frankia sp. Cas3]|uniref:hypothetical protein n=1 Tax=Frankia sp. Cas3 TaxID=3073926 RepID=UPI002AD27BE0|nr:hypothetical protein [Frankia sp. Cas3]